jgi:hypothetical protein
MRPFCEERSGSGGSTRGEDTFNRSIDNKESQLSSKRRITDARNDFIYMSWYHHGGWRLPSQHTEYHKLSEH